MEDRVIHFDNLNIVTALLPPNKNRAMYAVYDGHSGDEVAILAEQHLHNRVIRYLAHRNFCDDALDCLNRGIKEADEYICAVANAESTSPVMAPFSSMAFRFEVRLYDGCRIHRGRDAIRSEPWRFGGHHGRT